MGSVFGQGGPGWRVADFSRLRVNSSGDPFLRVWKRGRQMKLQTSNSKLQGSIKLQIPMARWMRLGGRARCPQRADEVRVDWVLPNRGSSLDGALGTARPTSPVSSLK